ncbi:MAG: SRPBCC family protein [Verrucomicrobia bacterium]|nr:SRPBCC family protein [Verrucomicrobiota bacterium]
MYHTNAIVMNAAEEIVFEAAANLESWPTFLPHYRYIHYYEKGPVRNVVKMAASRGRLPIAWVSEQVIDRKNREVRFNHLKAWTKGMKVVWKFRPLAIGVEVQIIHHLAFRVPLLASLAEPIIGGFFIDYIATRTLQHMKAHVEKK